MALENFRDLSNTGNDVAAGFQFEFRCSRCSRTWKSPFKPYRLGQITGLITRFTFMFTDLAKAGRTSGNFADIGARGARGKALAAAMLEAEKKFVSCPGCLDDVCRNCFDVDRDRCLTCIDGAALQAERTTRKAAETARERQGDACPNCGEPHASGRFCAECGFDMASTHKACPSCAAMLPRQARFCTDCGHGF